jgi:phospholipase/carboxylesterase
MRTTTLSFPARETPATHLAVLLHGVGDSADGFQGIAHALAPRFPRVDFLVADGFHAWDGGGRGRQWYSMQSVTEESRKARVREARLEVSPWLDDELASRGLAPDKLVLIGFSQGAILSASLAIHRSPGPAAVVMMSGRVAELDTPGPSRVSTPFFVAHGTSDGVIPVSAVKASVDTLEAWGAPVTSRVYPGLAHAVSAEELGDVTAFLAGVVGRDSVR